MSELVKKVPMEKESIISLGVTITPVKCFAEECIYLLLISQMLSLQITNFIESTLHDIFVYKAGAFTYFFRT